MLRSIFILISMGFLLSGCMQNNQANDLNNMNNNGVQNVNFSVNRNDKNLSGTDIAKRLVDIATRIPEVNDATAVVAGNYAVVGIDVDSELDRARVGTIKYTVAQALKKDPYGANAVVTSDADTIARLKKMNQAIKNGKPVTGIADQLAEIVERLMPEVPHDVQNPNNQNMMQENKNQIDNKGQRQKLENQQNDQKHTNNG